MHMYLVKVLATLNGTRTISVFYFQSNEVEGIVLNDQIGAAINNLGFTGVERFEFAETVANPLVVMG
jgi:hypothetical protein